MTQTKEARGGTYFRIAFPAALATWNEDELHGALRYAFGGLIHDWPLPSPKPPAPWRISSFFRAVLRDARIDAALKRLGLDPLTPDQRVAFWSEIRKGQAASEDAGGYLWRCWTVMLGYRVPGPVRGYREAADDILKGAE